jgi:hypothetical protein
MVLDGFKGSLLCNHSLLKLPFKLLEACFHRWEASWMWTLCLTITIRFLPDIIDHIIGGRWEDVIQRKLVTAIMHRRLGTSSTVNLLAMIYDVKKHWVA